VDWDSERIEERVLPLVARPGRYVGRELHLEAKPHGPERVSVLLAFPDAYEIGMSHLGLKILHHLVNRRDDALAEFVFAPWADMEEQMRTRGIPLFSIQTRTPARQFDVLGVSLQHELQYSNALNLLDLAGIPVRSGDRGEEDPLVVAGGPCCFNPLPLVPFIDAFAIGDGEDLIQDLVEVVREWKKTEDGSREGLLRSVADIPGMFVPGCTGTGEGAVEARFISHLDSKNYPARSPVPLMDIAHNRLGVEIMRGCTRGCRFCQAGMIGRPLREMPEDDVVELAVDGIDSGGWDEVALVSLSSSDYSGIESLISRLVHTLDSRHVGVCMPSLRPGGLTEGIARGISRFRHAGLTLAPEAGTDRLRRIINKDFDEDAFLEAVRTAIRCGWRQVKLYFMIGLPGETEEDLNGMVDLVRRVRAIRVEGRSISVKMSVSPFVPKPHTPFQWEPQISIEEINEKMRFLKPRLKRARVQLRWPKGEMTLVEGLLARGDERLADVVETVWRRGARFDGWTDQFVAGRWAQAMAESGLSFEDYTGGRDVEKPLPWSFVSSGMKSDSLRAERERALRAEATPDCRAGGCWSCMTDGLVSKCRGTTLETRGRTSTAGPGAEPKTGSPGSSRQARRVEERPGVRMSVRLRYAKNKEARFTSHLDVVRMFDRAIRRSGIPAVYTSGFNPRPRLAFGPPLPLGMTSASEYADLEMLRPWREEDRVQFAGVLPGGFELLDAQAFYGKAASLTRPGCRDLYCVDLNEVARLSGDQDAVGSRLEEIRRKIADAYDFPVPVESGRTQNALAPKDPERDRAQILSVKAEDEGGLRVELQTGAGLRRLLENTLVELLGSADILPLVRVKREAYDLPGPRGWVSPMEAVSVSSGPSRSGRLQT
jgi:radical SAM family uncharacterized protein